ncbi:MAG: hypothetical protein I8H72_00590 [Myxococcaceae bacterium]|nr:hypothetical protein [Myxococcaceae bacterium]
MWRQAIITVPEEDSDWVQQRLLELGALGLEIQDDQSLAVPERAFEPGCLRRARAQTHSDRVLGRMGLDRVSGRLKFQHAG